MKMKVRRSLVAIVGLGVVILWLVVNPASYEAIFTRVENNGTEAGAVEEGAGQEGPNGNQNNTSEINNNLLATTILEKLEVKGRAPKTGYTREQFYGGWPTVEGCSLRQRIIRREFGDSAVLEGCNVVAGEYDEPYTGAHLVFSKREDISKGIQIDHVVALSDAWQKGAQYMDQSTRYAIATDPLNLLAVDASANSKKSDGDAATWLPPNKKFRCQYVARQVSVKYKYKLWVTEAEKEAILNILADCPNQLTVGIME